MVKKFTEESQTKYQQAVEYAKKAKLDYDTININDIETFFSLHSCGISGSRLPDILVNNGITEDEAKKLVNEIKTNRYIFDFVIVIFLFNLGPGRTLTMPILILLEVFLNGNLKKPKKKPPQHYKKINVIMCIMDIEKVYGIKPYQGGIEAVAEGMGETTESIQKIWQTRNTKESASSGIALEKIQSLLEEIYREIKLSGTKPSGIIEEIIKRNQK